LDFRGKLATRVARNTGNLTAKFKLYDFFFFELQARTGSTDRRSLMHNAACCKRVIYKYSLFAFVLVVRRLCVGGLLFRFISAGVPDEPYRVNSLAGVD